MKPIRRLSVYSLMIIIYLTFGWMTISCEDPRTDFPDNILEPIQPMFESVSGTNAIGGSSEQKLAQVFMTQREGTLAGLYLPLACNSGQLEIEIRDVTDDEPGETVLSRQVFTADSIFSDVGVFKYFGMSGVPVESGLMLAVVLQNTDGSCGIMQAPAGDSYGGGEAFYDARPNPPGWRPLTIGTGVHDLPFMIVLKDI